MPKPLTSINRKPISHINYPKTPMISLNNATVNSLDKWINDQSVRI